MMNQIANVLKSHGVEKGDRVAIYMPACPLAVASMLACARIGAVHSVVFAGFSAEALASRIVDGIDPRFFFFLQNAFILSSLKQICFF
jgi:acetyl-CoA synthetase